MCVHVHYLTELSHNNLRMLFLIVHKSPRKETFGEKEIKNCSRGLLEKGLNLSPPLHGRGSAGRMCVCLCACMCMHMCVEALMESSKGFL